MLAAGPVRAAPLDPLRAREAEIARLDAERSVFGSRMQRLEIESRGLANQIEKLKGEPAGVRHDARLQELLAIARGKSDELERLSSELRARSAPLANGRRALMALCDRALAGQLPEATRLELSRLRAAQVAQLAQPSQPIGKTHVEADPLDGPRELSEKADLLRDSQDKLRREVARLSTRIDDVERRRHLRERAGALDEDWFGENSSNRRVARVAGVGGAAARGGGETADKAAAGNNSPAAPTGGLAGGAPSPAPGAGGPAAGAGSGGGTSPAPPSSFADPSPTRDSASVLRNLVDPSTLAELRRADGSDDLERQLRALRRAQGELEGLANELGRRAQGLSARAAELKKQK